MMLALLATATTGAIGLVAFILLWQAGAYAVDRTQRFDEPPFGLGEDQGSDQPLPSVANGHPEHCVELDGA